jgi:hypothetical protein
MEGRSLEVLACIDIVRWLNTHAGGLGACEPLLMVIAVPVVVGAARGMGFAIFDD